MDKYVVACNYAESISPVSKGSLAFVDDWNPGNGCDRIRVWARSRSGRWIQKWENAKRLTNFRAKTLPPEHPLYNHPLETYDSKETAQRYATR